MRKSALPARLRSYNRKRDFSRTAEPRGESPATAGRSFVIQQHDATRMHYDFRLEHRGVLLSWAVPKGPSLNPARKRLAVQTEDHPVSYREFEGHIPHGEYGGGPVIVWDRGSWDPEIDPDAGMRKGHLSFSLDGEKLQGRFQLVRLRGKVQQGPKSNWLLFKSRDEHALAGPAADITASRPESVLSGRRVEQIEDVPMATTKKATAQPSRKSRRPGRKKNSDAAMPSLGSVEPQLATLVDGPPPGSDWLYELKFDGYRMLSSIDGRTVGLRSRNDLDWTRTLPDIVDALKTLGCRRAILDGELCHVDDSGKTSFQKLQNQMPRGKGGGTPSKHLVYFVFDLLHLDGVDLRAQPLVERKAALRKLLGTKPKPPLAYSDHIQGDGHTAFLQACRAGLEGLIAKRAPAPYRGGRGKDWLKLKCQKRQEFVIAGFIRATGSREGFRSLVLGTRDDGPLKFAGRVGTGFTQESLRDLARKLKPRIVDASPLENAPRLSGVTWVKPDLVCEVQYAEITADGSLRHPSFQGLREDKPARQVKREKSVPVKTSLSPRSSSSAAKEDDGDVMGVRISHPERVMDSSSGVTKLDLARYHEAVQRLAMPYLANRPLSLVRCPDGGAHQCFFQKHVMPGVGKHVHKGRAGGHEILFVDEVVGLIELVQFNAIELHGWGATMNDPDHPDWFVIDLDPDTSLKFSDVVEAALEVREALKSLKLQSWIKTTGGKGLHVVVPIKPEQGWEQVKGFTQAIARSLEAQNPKRYVSTMAKAKRAGKIFVDYLRNAQGATAVLPYSPRARPGATVAMPVAWKDLKGLDPKEFTVKSAPRWIAKRRQDPWADFLRTKQRLPALD